MFRCLQLGALVASVVVVLPEAHAEEDESAQVPTAAPAQPTEPVAEDSEEESGELESLTFLTRVEVSGFGLMPRRGADGETESFLQVEPTFIWDGGEALGINLGAPLRLRVSGGGEGAGLLRKEDWDSLSDLGQIVRGLTLGSYAYRVRIHANALDGYGLRSGHLVRGYNNRTNPDYHPLGAYMSATAGPFWLEAFASDLLAARIFGAELEFDVGDAILKGPYEDAGRYVVTLSAVRDWGRSEHVAPSLTLAHMDGRGLVYLGKRLEVQVHAGWGGRPGKGAWGVVAGVGADAAIPTMDLRLRLEGRRQHGGFRQGLIGPDYELARFQIAGDSGLPLADARFPDGYSLFGRLALDYDPIELFEGLQRMVSVSFAAEVFTWGRIDIDSRFDIELFERNLELSASWMGVGMKQPGARYLVSGEIRWRFMGGALYALATAGTLLFPTTDNTLRPGAYISFGLGADNAR